MLKTAFLPRMTLKAAKELSGIRKSGKILSTLRQSNFFITMYPLPYAGVSSKAGDLPHYGKFIEGERVRRYESVYQYHPLFREFLLERARNYFHPEDLSQIQHSVATLLENAGMIEDAVSLLLEARDFKRLVPLIVSHAQTLLAQGRNDTLEKWITSIPHELLGGIECPWLSYWLGICRLPFNPRESRRHFENALKLFHNKKDLTGMLLSWSNAVETFFHDLEDLSPLDTWISLLDDILKKDTKIPSFHVKMRVSSSRFVSMVLRQPHHPEIEKLAECVFSYLHECKASLPLQTEYYLGVHYCWTGNFAKAGMIIDPFYQKTQREGMPPFVRLLGMSIKTMYAWLTGSIPLSLRTAMNALKLAREAGVFGCYGHLMAQGICAALSGGNLKTAEKLLRQFGGELDQARKVDVGFYHYLAAWYALLQGNVSFALEYIGLATKIVTEIKMIFPEAACRLLMAHSLFEQGKYAEALAHVSQAHKIGTGLKSTLIEYMCLLSRAYFDLNFKVKEKAEEESHLLLKYNERQKENGLASLRQAMKLGWEQGYVNMFGWQPGVMANLCAKALDAGIEIRYVQELISSRNLIPDASQNGCENWPWQVKVYTLGRFEIVKNGKPVAFSTKIQKMPILMLKVIVALGGRNVPCDTIADFLWPEAEGDMAYGSFRTTLHRLRKLLDNEKVIQTANGHITIDTRYCWVDVWAFQRIFERLNVLNENDRHLPGGFHPGESEIQNKEGDPKELVEKIKRLYRGDFLPGDSDQSWVISLRRDLRSKFDKLRRIYP